MAYDTYEQFEADAARETDPAKIEAGLTDKNSIVRQEYARKSNVQLTPEQIDRGLQDESDDVRLTFAKRTDYTPTPEQAERGLTDSNVEIATAFAERKDYTPTSAQVLRGVTQQRLGHDPDDSSLTDINRPIKDAFLRRDDVVMSQDDYDVAMEITDGKERGAIQEMQRRNSANLASQTAEQRKDLNPAAARLMANIARAEQENKELPARASELVDAARKRNEDLDRQQQQQVEVTRKVRSL